MVLVTTSCHCGVINIGMAVDGGQSPDERTFRAAQGCLAGLISGSGQTKINGVPGPRQAIGNGQLTKAKGVGKWNGTGPRRLLWRLDRRSRGPHSDAPVNT